MRKLFVVLFLLINFNLLAVTVAKRDVTDTVQGQLNAVKSILFSDEWEPVDSTYYIRMVELIDFIENSPIDSVVVLLKHDLDSTDSFFRRNIQHVSEAGNIEGYIGTREIKNTLVNIEKRAADELPLESILVPEEEYIGMYSKLPLITFGNIEKLITDSIITYPDTLLLLITDTKTSRSSRKKIETDSIITAFLDNARKNYNNNLISQYRDSLSNRYRIQFLEKYTDSLKKIYIDSVVKKNTKLLTEYNDSISKEINRNFKSKLESLVNYVDRMPYDITILNYYNDATTISLQNNVVNFQWVWLKNAQNDSIGLRIENLDKHNFRVMVDESVNLSRLTQKATLSVGEIHATEQIDQSLKKVKLRTPKLSPWKLVGKVYSGFTQTYINDYWSKGGNSSASTLSTFSYDANYSKGKVKWENGIDAKLGLIYYLPDEENTALRNWHKNSDNFEMNSRMGYSAFKEWYYSAEVNFKTQFFLGFKNTRDELPNSSIFSPAYLTISGGFDYKPNKQFSAFLSPLSVKTTFVTNPKVDETVFGLLEGQTRKVRFGMAGKLEYSKEVFKNVSLKTKNLIFINFGLNNSNEWQLIKIPDFDSETTIDFKVNQFINMQVNLHFIYDKDVESKWTAGSGIEQTGTRLQVKEFFTLGISYKFLK